MENIFITKLTLEKVRNLDYVEIPLAKDKKKHLIFTGKNGSGKTTILNSLSEYFDVITTTNRLPLVKSQLSIAKNNLLSAQKRNMGEQEIADRETTVKRMEKELEEIKKGFIVELNCTDKGVRYAFEEGGFIVAYYRAERIFEAEISRHVEKVTLLDNYTIYENPRKNFVKYLLDLKMTQALALSGNKKEKADGIQEWFDKFEELMRDVFENDRLKLDFDEETFCFYIKEPGKEPYDFNMLSSGYAAILDIVVDLMIRMEKRTERKFRYDIPGIVLIDEIETHLHLALQKKILKLLTAMFPNIQFIVTTHSPFVLNSLDDIVIYDLEQRLLVENGLSDIPYDGIVEGYFNASVLSDKLKEKFERYQALVKKEVLTDEDFEEITNLEMFLDEVPDYLALGITTEYQRLKLELSKREDMDG
ncbi:AAA family ATPase [Lachnospiraceae bacterium 38-10]